MTKGDVLVINDEEYILIESVKRGGTDYALLVDLKDNSNAIYGTLENDRFKPAIELDVLDTAIKLIAEKLYMNTKI